MATTVRVARRGGRATPLPTALLQAACAQQAPRSSLPIADYVHPRERSRGVDHLPVNGQAAIADGKLTGVAAGRGHSTAPRPAPVHDSGADCMGRNHFGKPR